MAAISERLDEGRLGGYGMNWREDMRKEEEELQGKFLFKVSLLSLVISSVALIVAVIILTMT